MIFTFSSRTQVFDDAILRPPWWHTLAGSLRGMLSGTYDFSCHLWLFAFALPFTGIWRILELRSLLSFIVIWGLGCRPLALGLPLLAEHSYVSTGLSHESYCDLQSGEMGPVGLATSSLFLPRDWPHSSFSQPFLAGPHGQAFGGWQDSWTAQDASVVLHVFTGPHGSRIGEASHPGPEDIEVLRIGTSNPAGLLRKEVHALGLGPGIWAFSETQLSTFTQPICTKNFRRLARAAGRAPTVLHGAAAPVRPSSSWAGAWCGVSVLSDPPAQRLQLSCPSEEYNCGRLQATRHVLPGLVVTVGNVYCYPRGPTWPNSKQLNNQLLHVLSGEIVFGCSGPRVILGDMNSDCMDQEVFDIWQRLGWQNLQQFAHDHWGWTIQPTSKHSAVSDHIWMSPEFIELARDIGLRDVFPDHASLHVDIEVPALLASCRFWHRPSAIPWDSVDDTWTSVPSEHLFASDNPTADYAAFGAALEASLDGHIIGQPDRRLQSNQRGRCQQVTPHLRPPIARTCAPSRRSEVQLRSDQVGSAVQNWFKQLRRLQSYAHAAKANWQDPTALTARLELWMSIRKARGFRHGFSRWWETYSFRHTGAVPSRVPQAPPNFAIADNMYHVFLEAFRSFEHWHLSQKRRLFALRYDRTLLALHQDLKPAPPERITLFWDDLEYEILDIDPLSSQVMLDKDIALGTSTWSLDGQELHVSGIDQNVCEIAPPEARQIGAQLIQRRFLHKADQIHESLLQFCKARWCAFSDVPADSWERVTRFIQAFVPKLRLTLPPITVAQWKAGLRRFKPHAAKGVDGLGHVDLLHLPDHWHGTLVQWLNRLEDQQLGWPEQMLHGIVLCLAKEAGAHDPNGFRPIVIFSQVYRTWGSIRSRQLLKLLTAHAPDSMFGFMPTKEATQLWWTLQSHIELALHDQRPLVGLSTDLIKAFNRIPRQHTFFLADHLGAPQQVTGLWKDFLSRCTRAFLVHDQLSEATTTLVGLPEGDAMSVYGMVQLNYAWHIYMRFFRPNVHSFSFVDNLSLMGSTVEDVVGAHFANEAFLAMWLMEADPNKTFTWALHTADRHTLRTLGLACNFAARDLGGSMTFCNMLRNHHLRLRFESLEAKWGRLTASRAPVAQKISILPLSLWPQALYGAEACLFADSHLGHLRTMACKCLKQKTAGVNTALRLTLSHQPLADPGFYQVIRTFQTFRRLVSKDSNIKPAWQHFEFTFAGKLCPGPFSKLHVLCESLGWSLAPPYVTTTFGLTFDVLLVDWSQLSMLLLDAWLQHLAPSLQHRKSMTDLHDLDPFLMYEQGKTLESGDRGLLHALHSGAFIANDMKAKFDVSKSGCPHCGVPDSVTHWLDCPLKAQLRESIPDWPQDIHAWPRAFQQHLLCPRNPWLSEWWLALADLPDDISSFECVEALSPHHLFTDGSCHKGPVSAFNMCSWSVTSATAGKVLSSGWLRGLSQTIPRAEATAVLSALHWLSRVRVQTFLWVDSKHTVDGVHHLLASMSVPTHWSNQDVWLRIRDLLHDLHDCMPIFHWWPSHLTDLSCEDGFHDWVKRWNSAVDVQAGFTNRTLPHSLAELRMKAIGYHENMLKRTAVLFRFYKAVFVQDQEAAAAAAAPAFQGHLDLTTTRERRPFLVSCTERLPINWDTTFFVHNHPGGTEFIREIINRLFVCGVGDSGLYAISWFEMVFLLVRELGLPLPMFMSSSNRFELLPVDRHFTRPLMTSALRLVRKSLQVFCRHFGFEDLLFEGMDRSSLGIFNPVGGFCLSISLETLDRVASLVRDWTSSRPIRRACDVARPF